MLWSIDLAGAEWIVTAYLCRDPAMLAVARSGKSPHAITGSRMFGVSEELVIKDDELTNELTTQEDIHEARKLHLPETLDVKYLPRTASMRNAAKRANFGLNYREGFKTYSEKNDMQEAEAKVHVHLYRDISYPGLKDWYRTIDAQVSRIPHVMTNCWGRKCYFMGRLDDETFRKATAFVPQSTVGDITNKALPLIMNDPTPEFEPCHMLAPVHDAIYFDYISLDFLSEAKCVLRIANDYLSPTITYHGESFKLNVDAKVGLDWGHLNKIKLTPDPYELAAKIESHYARIKARPTGN